MSLKVCNVGFEPLIELFRSPTPCLLRSLRPPVLVEHECHVTCPPFELFDLALKLSALSVPRLRSLSTESAQLSDLLMCMLCACS